MVPNMLEGWSATKHHFESLLKVLDTALSRSILVLERLGYRPGDNPLPDRLTVDRRAARRCDGQDRGRGNSAAFSICEKAWLR
jgi:hypothetical protein